MERGGGGGRRKSEEYDSWRDAILAVIKAIVAQHARGNEWKMDVNQAGTWEDKAGGRLSSGRPTGANPKR